MPTLGSMVKDALLTNIANRYTNSEFVASQLFPKVKVGKNNDYYAVYGKENYNLIDARIQRQMPFPETRTTMSSVEYRIEEFGLKEFISNDDAEVAKTAGVDVDADTVESLTQKFLLLREYNLRTVLNSIKSQASVVSTNQWTHSASKPIKQVLSGIQKVSKNTGMTVNTLLISKPAYWAALENDTVLARLSANTIQKVTPEVLKTVFEVDNVLVGGAHYNTAKSPKAANVANYIWGGDVILAYVAPAPSRRALSLGYEFVRHDMSVMKWVDPNPDMRGRWIGIHMLKSDHLTEALCGYRIRNAA